MIGNADARRTRANTARAWAQLTPGTPTNRMLARSTANTESWLTISAAVRGSQRSLRSVCICDRNREAASGHPLTGSRPNSFRTKDAIRAATRPALCAIRSLCITTASPAITPKAIAAPATAVPTNALVASPWASTSATATMGSTSLNSMLARKVAMADIATCARVNPHDVYMA